jgi:hypothetical protein
LQAFEDFMLYEDGSNAAAANIFYIGIKQEGLKLPQTDLITQYPVTNAFQLLLGNTNLTAIALAAAFGRSSFAV